MASPDVSCAMLARAALAVRPAVASVERATPRRARLRALSSPADATRDHSARAACLQCAGRRASHASKANARALHAPATRSQARGADRQQSVHRRAAQALHHAKPDQTRDAASSLGCSQRCNARARTFTRAATHSYLQHSGLCDGAGRHARRCNKAQEGGRVLTSWPGGPPVRTTLPLPRSSQTTDGSLCGSRRWIHSARLPPRTCSASGFARCGCRSLRSALASI